MTLYIEAVEQPAAGYGTNLEISASLSVNGTAVEPDDLLYITPVYNPDGWRAVARTEAGFDKRVWKPASGYSNSNRTQWKQIYSYYEKLYDDDYAAHGKGIALGSFQWMGLAKVAGNIFVDNADLSNSVASWSAALTTAVNNFPNYAVLSNAQQWVVDALTSLSSLSPAASANIYTHVKETQILPMQGGFAIFNDAAWQHVAYSDGGIEEIRRLGYKSRNLAGPKIMTMFSDKKMNVLAAGELINKGDNGII